MLDLLSFSDNHSYQRWRCGWDFMRFGIGHRDGSYYSYPYRFFINAKKQIHTIFCFSSAGEQSWFRVLQMFLFEYYLDILINRSIQVHVQKQYCTSAVVKDPRYLLSLKKGTWKMFWRMVNQVSREKRRFLTVLFSITVVLSTFEI